MHRRKGQFSFVGDDGCGDVDDDNDEDETELDDDGEPRTWLG